MLAVADIFSLLWLRARAMAFFIAVLLRLESRLGEDIAECEPPIQPASGMDRSFASAARSFFRYSETLH
jgi:hypothetical protein